MFKAPFLVGFDQVERLVDHITRAGDGGYPPFDIENFDNNRTRIALAVAGFRREDLTVTLEGSVLTIRGLRPEDDDRVYLHRGIAARKFQKKFVLESGLRVAGARVRNGLLEIDLTRPPAEHETREITIDES